MSGPIDETFTEQQLRPGTVFEFGSTPGQFTARMAKRSELTITAIDLYPAETTEGYTFIQGDFMDYQTDEKFDNVCSVSAWEHCGIERLNYQEGYTADTDYHLRVAEKLKSLVKPGGRLIITCPFGNDELYLTQGTGFNWKIGDPNFAHLTPKWGGRTFSLATLKNIFSPFTLVRASAFRLLKEDYFELTNWSRINPETDHIHFTDKLFNWAVIGVVFENRE